MRVWEVKDKASGAHVGLFYGDYFARKGKRSGAWAMGYRGHETFTGNTVNAFPGTPEAGFWTDTIQPPGTILVQPSLGDLADTLVVLSQAGGNCANCGSLELRATAQDRPSRCGTRCAPRPPSDDH